ncbi:MAG TPA: hypothetical protein IAB56_07265 [Candidatus Scybalousia intestinigallinarum]|nr:hypothetical protein [Candidatus Scybalousia intestinigallinarum]
MCKNKLLAIKFKKENKRTTKKLSLEHGTRKICDQDTCIQFMLEDGCTNTVVLVRPITIQKNKIDK